MGIVEPVDFTGTGSYSGNFPKELPTSGPIKFKNPKVRGRIGGVAKLGWWVYRNRKRLTQIASPFIGTGVAGLIGETNNPFNETLRPAQSGNGYSRSSIKYLYKQRGRTRPSYRRCRGCRRCCYKGCICRNVGKSARHRRY